MADAERADAAGPRTPPAPTIVAYDPITGVPSEFNEYLPKDCEEYKRWKAAQEGPEAIASLTLKDEQGNEIEKKLPGGKVKKKQKPQVILEINTRSKKKCVTTITGLDSFGVKLGDAAKLLGKKFACGASVTKTATGSEQIDMQGDFVDAVATLLVKTYGESHKLGKSGVYHIVEKKKTHYFDEEDDEDDS